MDQLQRNLVTEKLLRKITQRNVPSSSISRWHFKMLFCVTVLLLVFGSMQLVVYVHVHVRVRRSPLTSTSPLQLAVLTSGMEVPLHASDISRDPVPTLEIRNDTVAPRRLTSCPALNSMGELDANRTMDLKNEVVQSELEEFVFQSQLGKTRAAVALGNAQLMGRLHRNQTKNTDLSSIQEALGSTAAKVEFGNYTYSSGGHWSPADCLPRSKIAIIIPFRNRHYQLMIFLRYMVPFLQKQRLEFAIYVVNQENNFLFNKGILMNAGFLESQRFTEWDCIIFHDVDHIPQHEGNPYGCVDLPRHMMGGADNRNYRPPYRSIFGGVTAFNKDQFTRVNGFSNKYWGWCCEDDDMGWRVVVSGLKRTRYSGRIAYYRVIKEKHTRGSHQHEGENREYLRKRSRTRMQQDGVNSVKYNITHLEFLTLYTNISISFENSE